MPWSVGYAEAKCSFISKTLENSALMEAFRSAASLPNGYGVGFDERCVEYPWLLANLSVAPRRILDAGSALNHEFLLDQAPIRGAELHILTLAPEKSCFWSKGISYVFGDLREIPTRDNYYDAVVCVSTLEHVGCDNSAFSGLDAHREARMDDFTAVMHELNRVLRKGGTLYLTVPFGVHRNHGTFQTFDEPMVARAIAAFGPASSVSRTSYRYTASGWDKATELECSGCEYVDWVAKWWAGISPGPSAVAEPDKAAAARAVACIRIVKA